MRSKFKAVLILVAFGLIGCGKGDNAQLGESIPITFDSVPKEHQEYLTRDLKVLGGMASGSGDNERFEVGQFSGSAINSWLSPRLRYLIGKNFDYISNLPEPSGSSYRSGSIGKELSQMEQDFYGFNLGAHLYSTGKDTSKVVYVIRVGNQSVDVRTPRVGVVVVSDELFGTTRRILTSPTNSEANSYIRLATILHEARHSDGRGANVTFPHTTCDKTSRGLRCDGSSNGPNGVSSTFLKYAMSVCKKCDDKEQSGLQAVQSEVFSRINANTPKNDVSPESF